MQISRITVSGEGMHGMGAMQLGTNSLETLRGIYGVKTKKGFLPPAPGVSKPSLFFVEFCATFHACGSK